MNSSAQKPSDVPRYYRMLQTLNTQFNTCFRTLIMPFIFLTLFLINIISNYASIRLFHEIKMPVFLAFPLTSLATMFIMRDTFPTSYRVYEASQLLISSTMESAVRNGYVTKVMKSSKPIVIEVGPFFFIKQVTMMTYLEIVVDNAIMMLLSF